MCTTMSKFRYVPGCLASLYSEPVKKGQIPFIYFIHLIFSFQRHKQPKSDLSYHKKPFFWSNLHHFVPTPVEPQSATGLLYSAAAAARGQGQAAL